MKKLIQKMIASEGIRYLFFGGCSTLVNLIVFYFFRHIIILPLNIANFIAIVAAILFAYVVNSKFVFLEVCHSLKERLSSMGKFFGARIVTMIIEIFCVWLFAEVLHINEMISKLITQVIIVILNYVFSKLFVFTNHK